MDFPQTVLTTSKKGRLEVRALESRGSFVICKYLDSKTLKPADMKKKLILRSSNGDLAEYFIVPLKDPNRALLISSQPDEKERQVWNVIEQRAEEILPER
jgi:hypothetical protein